MLFPFSADRCNSNCATNSSTISKTEHPLTPNMNAIGNSSVRNWSDVIWANFVVCEIYSCLDGADQMIYSKSIGWQCGDESQHKLIGIHIELFLL